MKKRSKKRKCTHRDWCETITKDNSGEFKIPLDFRKTCAACGQDLGPSPRVRAQIKMAKLEFEDRLIPTIQMALRDFAKTLRGDVKAFHESDMPRKEIYADDYEHRAGMLDELADGLE